MEQRLLLEGQDMDLVSTDDLLAVSIWSAKLGTHRPLADGLLDVMQRWARRLASSRSWESKDPVK